MQCRTAHNEGTTTYQNTDIRAEQSQRGVHYVLKGKKDKNRSRSMTTDRVVVAEGPFSDSVRVTWIRLTTRSSEPSGTME